MAWLLLDPVEVEALGFNMVSPRQKKYKIFFLYNIFFQKREEKKHIYKNKYKNPMIDKKESRIFLKI